MSVLAVDSRMDLDLHSTDNRDPRMQYGVSFLFIIQWLMRNLACQNAISLTSSQTWSLASNTWNVSILKPSSFELTDNEIQETYLRNALLRLSLHVRDMSGLQSSAACGGSSKALEFTKRRRKCRHSLAPSMRVFCVWAPFFQVFPATEMVAKFKPFTSIPTAGSAIRRRQPIGDLFYIKINNPRRVMRRAATPFRFAFEMAQPLFLFNDFGIHGPVRHRPSVLRTCFFSFFFPDPCRS
ncbi:hypothetical protein GHT06_016269 [Daphnia sinensis]|uniref:Uncharacterized protein n=1 Tax=Daphnia sinensis TaxID=1820382 RepID=A0AAD5L5L2_9CRUS|nr:hypothetical protein GHT06_016269 [Daphnia sinensis]